jgi:hypothetical protein
MTDVIGIAGRPAAMTPGSAHRLRPETATAGPRDVDGERVAEPIPLRVPPLHFQGGMGTRPIGQGQELVDLPLHHWPPFRVRPHAFEE